MSEQVTYKVQLSKLTSDEVYDIERAIGELDRSEWLEDNNMVESNGNIYHAHINRLDGMDYCFISIEDDGTIDLTASFYNGGTCLSEVLANALEGL